MLDIAWDVAIGCIKLHEWGTWSITLQNEHRTALFYKSVLWNMLGIRGECKRRIGG
jgi:hypothetical protein